MGGDQDIDNLFGSGSEEEREDSPPAAVKPLQKSAADQRQDTPDEFADYEDTPDDFNSAPQPSGKPRHFEAPLIPPADRSKVHLLKLTNIVGVQTKPFESSTFEKEEDTYTDDNGLVRVRLRDSNVIRWKYSTDRGGAKSIMSNARIVKWSDGTWQLLLGDEVFDVAQQDISRDNVYLYTEHSLFQCQAQLTSRMVFRPSSLQSASHKRLKEAVSQRHSKVNKIQNHATLLDPEKEKTEQEKEIELTNKNRESQARRQNRTMQSYSAPRVPFTRDYLENDDYDDDDEELAAGGRRLYDERAEADAARRLSVAKRPNPAIRTVEKRRRVEDEEEDDNSEYPAESDDDNRKGRERGAKPKARRGVVLSEDEDED